MIKNITIGQYYPYDSIIHRLDPRVKIIATFVYMIMIFFVRDLVGYAFSWGVLAAVIGISHVPVKFIARGLKPIIVVLMMTFFLNLFLYDGTILCHLGPLTITHEGLRQAIYVSVRLIMLIFGASLLTYTTKPLALTDGFESMLRPLGKIGIPSHEISMMMSIALRFIPTLMMEMDKIMKAQKARGADFETGGIIKRMKNMIPILVPLFVRAFMIAQELALAMEARCYRGGIGRTKLKEMKYGARDIIAYLLIILFILLILLQISGQLPIPMIWKI